METPGSQSSLHRANLERVVRAVRLAGSLTQAEIARCHRAVRGHGLQHRPGAEGRRDRRGHADTSAGRPPGPQRLAQRRRGHRHRRRLRPHPPAGRRRQPRPPGAGRGVRAAGRGRLLARRASTGRKQLVGRLIADDRRRPGQGHRRRARRARPDRRGVRHAGLHRDPAGLGGHQPAPGARRSGSACPCTWTTTPTSARSGELVWGSGRGVKDLAYIKVASGVGAGLVIDGQIYRGPGRHGRRDRAHHAGRVGPGLPLRQPRLPGDLHRRPLRAAAAAGQPRPRADHGAGGPAGPRGRPGLPPGDRGRRAGTSAAAWRTCATCSTPAGSCWAAIWRRPVSWSSPRSGSRWRGTRSPARPGSCRCVPGAPGRPGRGAGRAGPGAERDGRFDPFGEHRQSTASSSVLPSVR